MDAARTIERTRVPAAVAAVFAAAYAAFSLVRHARLGTAAYDLGIFDQVAQRYSRGEAPIVELKGPGFNLLGDHFHPVLALLGPVYRVFPDARTLLVVQALVVASSLIPVGRYAISRLGTPRGLAVMAACGLSWGIWGLIAFDFHEVAFAVPLVACAVVALAEERWWPAVYWTLPLLLVKEDLGATVVAVGIYLLVRRQWKPGWLLVATGIVATALVTLVVLPAVNTYGTYRYWKALGGSGGDGLVATLLGLPARLVRPAGKLELVVLLLVTGGVVAVRSPILALVIPTLGWRFLSDNPLYWSTGVVHYNAILMPIAFVALVDAVVRSRPHEPRALRGSMKWAPAAVLVIAVLVLPSTPAGQAFDGRLGKPPARVAAARRLLAQVPDDAFVSASGYLVPQIVDRTRVVLFPNTHSAFAPDWIAADSRELRGVPLPPVEQEAAMRELTAGRSAYDLVAEDDGWVLFRRRAGVVRGTTFDRPTATWR